MRSQWRFIVVLVLFTCTALVLQLNRRAEVIPSRTPLSAFPRSFGDWESTDIRISQDVLDTLGPGDFLLRNYRDRNDGSTVNLFIAYFPSQRSGNTIHSPKNCLPGAGWTPVKADRITLNFQGMSFRSNRYLIAKGEARQLVLYSYWAHNRIVASEYSAKFYLVADSIRMHRTDGSLVRFTTYMRERESVESAQQRVLSFAANVVGLIPQYVPR